MSKSSNLFIQAMEGDSWMIKYPMSSVAQVDGCYLTILDDDGSEFVEMGLHPPTNCVETSIPLSEVINFYLENAELPGPQPYPWTDEETSTKGMIKNMKENV